MPATMRSKELIEWKKFIIIPHGAEPDAGPVDFNRSFFSEYAARHIRAMPEQHLFIVCCGRPSWFSHADFSIIPA
jgi:hypothetical protein